MLVLGLIGKPVYRQIFSGNYDDNQTLLNDIEDIIDLNGDVLINTIKRVIPYSETYNSKEYQCSLTINSSNKLRTVLFSNGVAQSSVPCNFIVEYTKTTDIGGNA